MFVQPILVHDRYPSLFLLLIWSFERKGRRDWNPPTLGGQHARTAYHIPAYKKGMFLALQGCLSDNIIPWVDAVQNSWRLEEWGRHSPGEE